MRKFVIIRLLNLVLECYINSPEENIGKNASLK